MCLHLIEFKVFGVKVLEAVSIFVKGFTKKNKEKLLAELPILKKSYV